MAQATPSRFEVFPALVEVLEGAAVVEHKEDLVEPVVERRRVGQHQSFPSEHRAEDLGTELVGGHLRRERRRLRTEYGGSCSAASSA